MSSATQIEELFIEFVRTQTPEDAHAFPGHRLTYIISRSFGAPRTCEFPWDDAQIQNDILRLSNGHPDELAMARLGKQLRLFLGAAWDADEETLEKALKTHQCINLTIRSEAAEIYHLPWELVPLHDSGMRLGEIPQLLIRYEWPRARALHTESKTIHILLAASSASGHVPFDEHLTAIKDACQSSQGRTRSVPELDFLPNASIHALTQKLNNAAYPIDVLHLLCHGTELEEDTCGLLLHAEDPEDVPEPLNPGRLGRWLSSLKRRPRLIVLCVCRSSDMGRPAHLLGSIAATFHRRGIPAVIASRMPLSGSGSILFTKTFYEELLAKSGHLRAALAAARVPLLQQKSLDWASLQLYARHGDESALDPFRLSTPPPQPPPSNRGALILLCHEAHSTAYVAPEAEDMPALFANREVLKIEIDQTHALQNRNWERLGDEVERLLSPERELRQLLTRRDVELVYYGFPYISLAALVGFLANTRPVHVVEYDREVRRFTWMRDAQGSFPPLSQKRKVSKTGNAARLRLSISASVSPEDCEQVLPGHDVGLDLHFTVKSPQRGLVRTEAQLDAYIQQIRTGLDRYVAGNRFQTLHVFASVPVSIALRLGQVLAATGLPPCCVYNYGGDESPRYKWRLWLRQRSQGSSRVDIF